jgi:Amidohydrolase family
MEALRLYTVGSSWFSSDEGKKGAITGGQLADLAVLSADYFSIPEEQIKQLESVLTIVGGKVVYAAAPFSRLAPPQLPVSPDWSPVASFGGYAQHKTKDARTESNLQPAIKRSDTALNSRTSRWILSESGSCSLGCDCFAF